MSIPGGSDKKESALNAGDPDSIPGQEDTLQKGMTTHSSILAWRIPWIEQPSGLQSTGSQRVRHKVNKCLPKEVSSSSVTGTQVGHTTHLLPFSVSCST